MKRLASLGALLALLLAIPLSHLAFSDPPEEKVKICHLPAGQNPGIIIEVSPSAAAAHIEKHGDCYASGDVDTECTCKVPPDTKCAEKCRAALDRCTSRCKKDDALCLKKCQLDAQKCLTECVKATAP